MFFKPDIYKLPYDEFRLKLEFFNMKDLQENPYEIQFYVNVKKEEQFTQLTLFKGSYSNEKGNKDNHVEIGVLADPGDPSNMFLQKTQTMFTLIYLKVDLPLVKPSTKDKKV